MLKSMNLRVNNNGVLELISSTSNAPINQQQQCKTIGGKEVKHVSYNQANFKNGNGNANVNANSNLQNSNNYIYNKYFQDFKNQLEEKEQEDKLKNMTPQEYRREMIKRYLKQQQDIQMIRRVKSKKLQFHTGNINISRNNLGNKNNLNNLFRLLGK